jgi:hypothetical protein
VKSGVNAITELASSGSLNVENLSRSFAANVVGGSAANKIGISFSKDDIHELEHLVAHALTGAGVGYIIDGEKGALSGAVGAVVAETVANFVYSKYDMVDDLNNNVNTKDKTEIAMALAKVGVVMAASAFNLDVNTALTSANNSLDNNFAHMAVNLAAKTIPNSVKIQATKVVQKIIQKLSDKGALAYLKIADSIYDFISGNSDGSDIDLELDALKKENITDYTSVLKVLAENGVHFDNGLSLDQNLFDKSYDNLQQFYNVYLTEDANGEASTSSKLGTGGASSGGDGGEDPDENPEEKKPHGNSLNYKGETHVYAIKDGEGSYYKIGESTRGTNSSGQSRRATEQTNKIQRKTGDEYTSRIRKIFDNKADAKEWETALIKRFRKFFGEDQLAGNKGVH